MKILQARLKSHEGLSLIPYRDTNGYWTIGHGHKLTGQEALFSGTRLTQQLKRKWRAPNIVITEEDAQSLFLEDLYRASDRFMAWQRRHCPKLNVTRSGVCVELIFWMGFGGFKKFRKMIKAVKGEDYQLAALELYNSTLGKYHSGRAKTLAVLMWEGE